MNPLNLTGPQFLAFYIMLIVSAVVVAIAWRSYLRQPIDELFPDTAPLSAYEAAYLEGGEDLAVNAAVVHLVQDEILSVKENKLVRESDVLPADAHALEKKVFDAVEPSAGSSLATVQRAAKTELTPIRERLQDLGLLVSPSQASIATIAPLLVVLAVPALGVIKILVGVSRGKPVGFLVILCIASVIIAFVGFGRKVTRSRRGDGTLERLKTTNAAMKTQVLKLADQVSGDDMAMALALFGVGILAGSPLSPLQPMMRPPPTVSSSCGGGSSCGSSCGGGCGGGCGGCGG
jgi:uncharacterized protein (TIGR04222 family)